jgi:signal transduction histidine kinase
MLILGVFLIYTAVVLRAAVVLSTEPELPIVMALLAGYGVLLVGETWFIHRKRAPYLQSRALQLAYLLVQSVLIIVVLITSTFEDFPALLFIPLSLDAVAFFGRRVGYRIIAIFSLLMILTFLFSDEGQLFGLAMGTLYSGVFFLFGGYAHQVQKARAIHDQNELMFNELQAAYRQLQGYADHRASLAIEQERNRLARDLHDSVTQTVFSMNLAAQSAYLLADKEPPRVAGQLLRLEELAASALREIQSLVSQLRPRTIMEEGLPAALRRLAVEQKMRAGLQIALEIHGECTLSETVATGLYSIAQEALTNVSKHSGVCEATVRLQLKKDHSCLEIEDHGRGFDPDTISDQRGHLGLAGMSERACEIGWRLSVLSRPGQGTRIAVTDGSASPSGNAVLTARQGMSKDLE